MERMILVVAMLAIAGCVTIPHQDAVYQFSPTMQADGTKGYMDSYGGISESLANANLGASLAKANLCPNGWIIVSSGPSPIYAPVTDRVIKCR